VLGEEFNIILYSVSPARNRGTGSIAQGFLCLGNRWELRCFLVIHVETLRQFDLADLDFRLTSITLSSKLLLSNDPILGVQWFPLPRLHYKDSP